MVQESIIVIKDIFRKYPSTYEGVIPTLCANLDELDEPEAKASLIWIIGEYANKIDNADELLGIFVDTFTEESYPVREVRRLWAPNLTTHDRCNCKLLRPSSNSSCGSRIAHRGLYNEC